MNNHVSFYCFTSLCEHVDLLKYSLSLFSPSDFSLDLWQAWLIWIKTINICTTREWWCIFVYPTYTVSLHIN